MRTLVFVMIVAGMITSQRYSLLPPPDAIVQLGYSKKPDKPAAAFGASCAATSADCSSDGNGVAIKERKLLTCPHGPGNRTYQGNYIVNYP